MKETLVYESSYNEIQQQDLPPEGYYFVCQEEDRDWLWLVVIDGGCRALCYAKEDAVEIAEMFNSK